MSEHLIDAIDEVLPQTQCRQCGFDGCRNYAWAIAMGEAPINRCAPGGQKGIEALARVTGQNPLPLDDWRRANVNALISGVYTAVKFHSKDTVFSVSPAASIENNYSRLFADVKSWIESGCVDCIIPQLYFGFSYPDDEYKFENLLEQQPHYEGAAENGQFQFGIIEFDSLAYHISDKGHKKDYTDIKRYGLYGDGRGCGGSERIPFFLRDKSAAQFVRQILEIGYKCGILAPCRPFYHKKPAYYCKYDSCY